MAILEKHKSAGQKVLEIVRGKTVGARGISGGFMSCNVKLKQMHRKGHVDGNIAGLPFLLV